jgi:cytoskeletal protein CcmA (bactofilin family)
MGLFGRAQRPAQTEALESAVGPSSTMKGTLRSDGGVRVDGVFEGIIEVAGNVVVGRDGRVTGDITARNVTVGGVVHGNIDGTGQLQILATGQVIGDIAVASVMIDEGGMFQGNSRLRGLEQAALPAPAQEEDVPVESAPASAADDRTVEAKARMAPDTEPPARAAARSSRRSRAGRTGARAPAAESGAPEAAARTFDDGLDIDLGSMDIEPIIPVLDDEHHDEPPPEPEPPRPSRRGRRS